MIKHLIEEEIVLINEIAVKITNETHEIRQIGDIRFIANFVKNSFNKDYYKKALAYCVSIIVFHPFGNGNHRTSILSAENFLLKNGFKSFTNDKKDKELERFRLEYEEKHDLEREFFRITIIEDNEQRKSEINNVMNSEYGINIENWLKKNYKKK